MLEHGTLGPCTKSTNGLNIEAVSTSEANNSSRLSDKSNAITDYRRIQIRVQRKKGTVRKQSDTQLNRVEPTAIDLTDPEIQETIAKIAESNAKRKEEERRHQNGSCKTSISTNLKIFQ